MAYTTVVRSWPALIGGVIAAGIMTALLVRDASANGVSLETFLMPAVVVLTILAAHLAGDARRAKAWGSMLTLGLLAALCSIYTVYESSGRRAELLDAKVMGVENTEQERSKLRRKLAEAESILTTHRAAQATECASGKGSKCDGRTYTVHTWEAAALGYETRLKALPPPKPANAIADRIAGVVSLVGGDGDKAKIVVGQFHPFWFTILAELAAIFMFRFAFGHAALVEIIPPSQPCALDPVLEALRHGPLTNDELADRLGVRKGAASKLVSARLGQIRRERVGREVRISLAAPTMH